jgi:hypothetical protein
MSRESKLAGGRSIVGRLVAKDLYLYRWLIAAALVAGAASLVLSGVSEGDNVRTGMNAGFVLFLTTIIAFGIAVAMIGLLRERQEKSQLFVLSLPVSPAQYQAAKVVAALVAFLGPWALLTGGVVALTLGSDLPDGGIPFFVAMMTFFLGNFCTLLALIAITLSELWAVAGILVTNVSVTFFLARIGSLPEVVAHRNDAAATWGPAILTVLAVEAAWIALALALAFYLPSRRKDLV